MTTDIESLFDDTPDESYAPSRKVYPPKGKYICRVDNMIRKTLRGNKGIAFITACEMVGALAGDAKKFPVGETFTYYQGFEFEESDMKLFKSFLLAAYQSLDPSHKKVSKQMLADAYGAKNALQGAEVLIDAWCDDGKTYVKKSFRAATPADRARISVDENDAEEDLDDLIG